jgi:hypothetical protein
MIYKDPAGIKKIDSQYEIGTDSPLLIFLKLFRISTAKYDKILQKMIPVTDE